MGLDQYIFKEIENEYEEDGRTKVEEIHYWRKIISLKRTIKLNKFLKKLQHLVWEISSLTRY